MKSFAAVLDDLGHFDWSWPEEAHLSTREMLAAMETDMLFEGARASVRRVDPEFRRSAEKTTHFKWFVAADPVGRFELFLHQYKLRSQRRSGHAEVPHNHRYWFTSMILRGAYENRSYDRNEDGVRAGRTKLLTGGDVLTVRPSEVHAVERLEEGTVSLIVQSRPVRGYSEVFEDGRIVRYLDLQSQYEAFVAAGR